MFLNILSNDMFFEVYAEDDDTILRIKKTINDITAFPLKKIVLSFKTKELDSSLTLKDYDICDRDSLILTLSS